MINLLLLSDDFSQQDSENLVFANGNVKRSSWLVYMNCDVLNFVLRPLYNIQQRIPNPC